MSLQTITNINVDFYDKKYILINAKQLDKSSRFLSVTCYNHGEIFRINSGEHSAYIRYKKADDNGVFNFCDIDRKGNILVELTEQMLASDGICCADLVIVNKGSADVNVETGEIVAIDNAAILSTMTFCIDVSETAVSNSDIESSYEYDGLNIALEKAEAEYTEVIKASKSWAVGDTGIRNGENTDNAKYYAQQSSNSSNAANTSALNAANSERLAAEHMQDALSYSQNAQVSMNSSEAHMNNAKTYMDNAKSSEDNAKISEQNAKASETNAQTYMDNAKISETNAEAHMNAAKISEENALNSANLTQSYAVGGTGIRENEDKDNAAYYYEMVKTVANGLNSGFIPMGTISFAELVDAEKATGFSYNISDDFVTDETFREGAGKLYAAGTNVYYTADGYWDCFGGYMSPIATVNEVKSYLGIE